LTRISSVDPKYLYLDVPLKGTMDITTEILHYEHIEYIGTHQKTSANSVQIISTGLTYSPLDNTVQLIAHAKGSWHMNAFKRSLYIYKYK
jgi:hypothetical protein